MDTFWSDLLNPGAIVRTLIIGFIFIFITRGVNQYLTYRSVKSIQRRIKNAEDHKLMLSDLATSDRSVLLFSFRTLFVLLAMASLAFIAPALLSYVEGDPNPRWHVFVILIWTLICFIAGYAARTLEKADDYPASTTIIDQKLVVLKDKLAKRSGGNNTNS